MIRGAALIAALTLSLAACGGGDSAPPADDPAPPVETVTGVATPSSVAVVTATNTQ
jgi:hypothetical protein